MRPSAEIIRSFCFLMLIGAAVASGCRDATKPSKKAVESTAAKVGTMPSDEECRQFAGAIQKAVKSGDGAAVDRLIDYDAILESATGGVSCDRKIRRQFISENKSELRSQAGLGTMIARALGSGGSYDFLRISTVDGKKRVLFRMLLPNGGLNYHEWIVVKDPSGNVRSIDVFIYLVGESFAQTLRPWFLDLVKQNSSSSSFFGGSGTDGDLAKHASKLPQIAASARTGQFQRALQLYNTLPASLKKKKSLLITRLQAATGLRDNNEMAAAVRELMKHYPNDPCIALVSLDYHFLNKDYEKVIACVDKLDKAVGGDPYLKTMRAGIFRIKGDVETAARLAVEAAKEERELQERIQQVQNSLP